MAENRFDPMNLGLFAGLGPKPRRNSLLDLVAPSTPPAKPQPMVGLLGALPGLSPASNPFEASQTTSSNALSVAGADLSPPDHSGSLANILAGHSPFFAPPSAPTSSIGSLGDLVARPLPALYKASALTPAWPKSVAPEIKRKVFFSFHFDDIMRVNNVRNTWKISHPDSASNRSFYDSSLWEERKVAKPEVIKQLIRVGVCHTSVVCVLAGSATWERRWVRYEIARAIIDGRGLVTVHLNNINHHLTKRPHPLGRNPLAHMGVAKLQPNNRLPAQYYIYEMSLVPDGYGGLVRQWTRYGDYTAPISKPTWLADPPVDHIMPLSVNAAEYDYELDYGHRNIGSWIDEAAKQLGR